MNQAQLQALVEKQIGKGHIYNIVIGVQSADGRIDLSAAAGEAHPHSPMHVGSPYFIASVTKMYTTALIMKLMEEGELDLDAPLHTYLPGALLAGIHTYQGQDYSHQIRLHHLLAQTSGLADYFEGKPKGGQSLLDEFKAGGDFAIDIDKVLEIVRRLPANFPPGARNGTQAHYSDTNYQLLGAVIEAVTGQSVAQNFEQKLFAPLGLQHTYVYEINQSRAEGPPASMYYKSRLLKVPLFMSTTAPDGGIVSTSAESLAFLRAFFEGALFQRSHLERMTHQWNSVFFPIQYGYGLMRFKLPRLMSPFQPTPELIGHSGANGAFAFYHPAKLLYFAGTVNQLNAPGKPFQLMMQLINKIR